MSKLVLAVACAVVVGALGTSPAGAQMPLCPSLRLGTVGGTNDILGNFREAGVRCSAGAGWVIATGVRHTDQRGTILSYALLTYDRALAPQWRLTIAATVRERGGDYEIDRLPEFILRWQPPIALGSVSPTLHLHAGSIAAFQKTHTSRLGAVLDLTLPISLGGRSELLSSLRLATFTYGTGATHSYVVGAASLIVRPGEAMELGLSYLQQDGAGTSPLGFDQLNREHLLTGRIGWRLNPSNWLSVAATLNLATSPATMKEYILSWWRPGGMGLAVTWRQTDGRIFLSLLP